MQSLFSTQQLKTMYVCQKVKENFKKSLANFRIQTKFQKKPHKISYCIFKKALYAIRIFI